MGGVGQKGKPHWGPCHSVGRSAVAPSAVENHAIPRLAAAQVLNRIVDPV